MTFILNVLHKDFSLIASDRKATSEGPTKIETPGLVIHAKKGVTIQGYKKIHIGKEKNIAIGIAGKAGDHSYISKFEKSENVHSTLSLIHKHMEDFLIKDHKIILELDSYANNQGIVTYYEPETNEFFSNFYGFGPIHNYIHLYPSLQEKGFLISAGSGSSVFESAVGTQEITQFADSLNSLADVPACLEWIKQAYKKSKRTR